MNFNYKNTSAYRVRDVSVSFQATSPKSKKETSCPCSCTSEPKDTFSGVSPGGHDEWGNSYEVLKKWHDSDVAAGRDPNATGWDSY